MINTNQPSSPVFVAVFGRDEEETVRCMGRGRLQVISESKEHSAYARGYDDEFPTVTSAVTKNVVSFINDSRHVQIVSISAYHAPACDYYTRRVRDRRVQPLLTFNVLTTASIIAFRIPFIQNHTMPKRKQHSTSDEEDEAIQTSENEGLDQLLKRVVRTKSNAKVWELRPSRPDS